jgi:hypothetical protein
MTQRTAMSSNPFELPDLLCPVDEFYPGSKMRRDAPRPGPDDSGLDLGIPYDRGIPDDPEMELYTIGVLALALNRDSRTIRTWERLGRIPLAQWNNFVHDAGCASDKGGDCDCPPMDVRAHRRLYTRTQIEGMVSIAAEEGILENTARHITKTKFTERVLQQWREQGWY